MDNLSPVGIIATVGILFVLACTAILVIGNIAA
jgi:hypothetical protein